MHTDHELQVPRAAAVVGLGSIALIHLLDLQGKFQETPYLGVGYLLLIAACVVAGGMLLHRNARAGWLLAGAAAVATLAGYTINRTVGMPGATEDIGNWLEPLGLASLFAEGCVAAIAVYALKVSAGVAVAAPVGSRSGALRQAA